MFELVVVACLMAEPKRCEAFHLPFLRALEAFECVGTEPTFEVVRWAREHPGWTIRRWSCARPSA